jgi:hypothetical protein
MLIQTEIHNQHARWRHSLCVPSVQIQNFSKLRTCNRYIIVSDHFWKVAQKVGKQVHVEIRAQMVHDRPLFYRKIKFVQLADVVMRHLVEME